MSESGNGAAPFRNAHRPNRFYVEAGKWYFETREGTIEGPFDYLLDAEARLEAYLESLESGGMRRRGMLELEPLQMRWR
jgi:hypothetical protein